MVISTLDEIIAGLRPPEDFLKVGTTMEAAGILHSLFYTPGRPGAGVVPTPGLAGEVVAGAVAGQLPFFNPPLGQAYLARLQAGATQAGALLVLDRLWHNSGIAITTTGAQTVNSVAWPPRDRDGASDGRNVLVGLEVSTATGNASPVTNTTLGYSNQAGTAGRTATIASFPATAAAGTFVPFALGIGDTGVRSIQSLTLGTSYVSGVVHLVVYRVLARLELPLANTGGSIDPLTGGFPRLHDNTSAFLVWHASATTAVTVSGQVAWAWG